MDNKSNKNFEIKEKKGKRFEFGKNWKDFLSVLTVEQIIEAEKSTCDFLGVKILDYELRNFKLTEYGFGNNQYLFQKVKKV